jgi:hypothetical protein
LFSADGTYEAADARWAGHPLIEETVSDAHGADLPARPREPAKAKQGTRRAASTFSGQSPSRRFAALSISIADKQ